MILVLLGSVCSSWLGIGVRVMVSASAWQILVYRSMGVTLFLLVFIAIRNPGALIATFRAAGPASLVGGIWLASASSAIIVAIERASVANAMF